MTHLRESHRPSKTGDIFQHIHNGLKGMGFTDFIKNQFIGVDKGVLHTLVWILEHATDWLFAGPESADF